MSPETTCSSDRGSSDSSSHSTLVSRSPSVSNRSPSLRRRFPSPVHALCVFLLALSAASRVCEAQDETSEELRFLEWLHGLGGKEVLPQRAKLRISRAQGGERGMAAAADIAAGEEVVSVPFKAAIVAEESDPEPFKECGMHMVLMAKLLREMKKGNASEWAAFTAILPSYIPLPWLPLPHHRKTTTTTTTTTTSDSTSASSSSSSTEAVAAAAAAGLWELQLPSAVVRGAALEAYMRDAYERSDRAVLGGATYGDFLWAFAMYLTRHFSLNLPPSDPRGTISMFLPFGDMANHRFRDEWDDGDVDWVEGVYADRAVLVSLRPVSKGHPVFETYWNGPNEAFCVFQAFLPEPNPHDTVTLFQGLRHGVAWLLGFLQREGRLPDSVVAGYAADASAAAGGVAAAGADGGAGACMPIPKAFEEAMLRLAVAAAAEVEGAYEQHNHGSSSSSDSSDGNQDTPQDPHDPQEGSDGRNWAATAPFPPLPLGFSLPADGRDSTANFDAPEAVTVGRRWKGSRRALTAFAAVIREVQRLVMGGGGVVGGEAGKGSDGGGGGATSADAAAAAARVSQHRGSSAWGCTAAEEASLGPSAAAAGSAAAVFLAQIALVERCREMLLALPTTLQHDLALLARVTGNIADVTGELAAAAGGAGGAGGADEGGGAAGSAAATDREKQGCCERGGDGAGGDDRVCEWKDGSDTGDSNRESSGGSSDSSGNSSQGGLSAAAYELALRFRIGQKRLLQHLVQEWQGD
ncbi:unnamed protein product [Closterium sp. Naga37s-1]|nr:unnamed protein product [Closterium sp. Naga37s-1]